MAMYKQLMKELEKLKAQAQQAQLAEKAEALEQICAMIIEHQLLPSDLGFIPAGKRLAEKASAKYKDPATGATWSGRGRAPKWLDGRDRAKYEI